MLKIQFCHKILCAYGVCIGKPVLYALPTFYVHSQVNHCINSLLSFFNVLPFSHQVSPVKVMLLSLRLIAPLFLLLAGVQAEFTTKNCKLISESETEKNALNLLEPLTNQK